VTGGTLARVLLAALLLVTFPALAQVGVRPGDVQPKLPPFEPPGPPPERILPPIPQPHERGRVGSDVRLFVRAYRFTGNTVFTPEQLVEVAAPWTDREITSADIQALRDAVTLLYVRAGYVTSGAVVPDQSPKDGVVEVQIVEGSLEAIEVVSPGWLRESYVKSRLERAAGTPLDVNALEERIQLLQQDPHVSRVRAELRPGSEPGEALLQVQVEETPPWSALFETNNYQPPSIGAYGGHFALGWNDVTGFGDSVSAAFDVTQGLREIDASYALPLTRWDTRLELGTQLTESKVVEHPFDALNIRSETASYSATLRQPLYTTLAVSLSTFLTGEWRYSKTFLLGEGFPFVPGPNEHGIAKLAVLRFGQDVVWRDRVQVIAARSMFSFGLDVLGATRKDCVDGFVDAVPCGQVPDGTYFAWLGQLQWARRFDSLWGIETVFRTDLQLSNQPLLGLEQFAVGGHATVRGYRENQLVRDQGIVSSIELRIPLWKSVEGRPIVQLAPFFDIGHSWNARRPTPSPKTLPSVGIGLRWAVTRFLDAQLYWGQNLKDVEGSGVLQVQGPHDLQDAGVQFSVRMQLP